MKKLEDVIARVQSPFSDDFIKSLIKTYLDNDCDFHTAYDAINNAKENDLYSNEHINTLMSVIGDRGTHIENYKEVEDSSGWHKIYDTKPIYEKSEFWMVLMSNPDAFEEYNYMDDDGSHLLYRIYLNLKGKDKLDCVMGYIEECHKRELDYKFKFATKDGGDDEIIIQSTPEHFLENLSIIQGITNQMQLGKTPMLVGKYENNIGIAEEFYDRGISPTSKYIYLLGSALIKYICDHNDVALDLCSGEEKEILDGIYEDFEDKREHEKRRQERGRSKLKCGAKITGFDSSSKNILGSDEMCMGKIVEVHKLNGLIRKLYDLEPETFLNEITSNVRYIGNNVFGISKDMVFSVTTENNIEASKKKDTVDVDI